MAMRAASSRLWWAVVGCACVLSPAAAREPPQIESDRYRVSVTALGECCPTEIKLAATDHLAGSTIEVELAGRVQELEGLHLYDHRVVVHGELPWGGDVLLVADLRAGRQEESIRAYGFSFSPSGRYLFYRGHYPRAVGAPGRRSIALLYDLAKSAEENREGLRQDYPCANQGRPVFPESSAFRGDPCITEVEDRLWVSPFLWSSDERRVFFFECSVDWVGCYLVSLGLPEDDRPPVIWRRQLHLRRFTRREGLYQYTGEPGEPVRLAVRSLAWKNRCTLSVDAHPESGLVSPFEIELPLCPERSSPP